MLTFTRILKDGSAVEFKFTCEHDNTVYDLDCDNIDFHFSIRDKNIATFRIDTNKYESLGYGTALMSIMFEIIETYHKEVEVVSGWLSISDYRDHGNLWQRSIPFYLKQRNNAYLIKCDKKLYTVYNSEDANTYFKNKYYSYEEYIRDGISDGYIIYPFC